jgi:hypothetical protein
MHAPDGTVIRGPERRQWPPTVGVPGKSVLTYTAALFSKPQPPMEVVQHIPKAHQYVSLLVSCDCSKVLTKIESLHSSKIHTVM